MNTVVVKENGTVVVTREATRVITVRSPGPQGPKGTNAWSEITDKPTTLAGYGITDAAPSSHVGAGSTAHANVVAGGAAGFMTGADKTKLDGISGNNTGNETAATIGTLTAGATAKATPVDADSIGLSDSAASNVLKKFTWANLKAGVFAAWGALIGTGTGKTTPADADALAIMDSASSNATKTLTWANLKATLKTYFDTLYATLGANSNITSLAGLTTPLSAAQGGTGHLYGSALALAAPVQTASAGWGFIDFLSLPNSDFTGYELELQDMVPNTNAVNLVLQFYVAGVLQTASYVWGTWRWTTAGSGVIGQPGTGTGIALDAAGADAIANVAGQGNRFVVRLPNLGVAGSFKRCEWSGSYFGSAQLGIVGFGISPTTDAVDGLRITFDSGTGQAGATATLRGMP